MRQLGSPVPQAHLLAQVELVLAHHVDGHVLGAHDAACHRCRLGEDVLHLDSIQLADNAVQPADAVIGVDDLMIELVLYLYGFLIILLQEAVPSGKMIQLVPQGINLAAPAVADIAGEDTQEQIGGIVEDILRHIENAGNLTVLVEKPPGQKSHGGQHSRQ